MAVLLKPVVVFWSAPVPLAVFRAASLSSLFGGAPQLGAPPSIRMRPVITNAFPQILFMSSSSYEVQENHHITTHCLIKDSSQLAAPGLSVGLGPCRDRGQGVHDGMLSPSIPRSLHQYRQATPVLCVRLCPTRACITGSSVCVGRGC